MWYRILIEALHNSAQIDQQLYAINIDKMLFFQIQVKIYQTGIQKADMFLQDSQKKQENFQQLNNVANFNVIVLPGEIHFFQTPRWTQIELIQLQELKIKDGQICQLLAEVSTNVAEFHYISLSQIIYLKIGNCNFSSFIFLQFQQTKAFRLSIV
ncbi:hypothetical protein pb186bvf_001874 [Paramecium bursaria]